jgi:nicotinamide-nucleotide amidase
VIVEVIAIGTELLLGEIVNSNVAVVGRRLADEGFDTHFHVTVGDNLERMVAATRQAIDRADAVILTGGIGPTQDDVTREALCIVGDRTMERDEAHAELIRDRITRALGSVVPSTLRMADHPSGTETLRNRNGVALGIAMVHDGVPVYALPGVPSEMAVMLDEQVLPRLRAHAGEPAVLRSRLLRTWGWGESRVADALDDLFATANPSIAFLVDGVEVRVRISAKAADAERAEALIDRVADEVRARLGPVVFGTDHETVEALVARHLDGRGWRLGTVEVATLGAVASSFARTAVAAGRFAGALVVPADEATATDPVADVGALLDRGADALEADVLVAVGRADVGGGADQDVRRVTMGVRTPHRRAVRTVTLLGDAPRVRIYARGTALHLARLAVSGVWWDD